MVRTISDKIQLGKVKRELVEKANLYKELTGTSRVKLVESLLTDFFKDKILTNDFIELPKPYYFNLPELVANNYVKATSDKPIKELEYSYILFNVPNNLDSYNAEIGSYCFEDNPDLHRGYYISSEFKFDFVFSYNSKTEELEIATSNDRDIYFSSDQKEEKEKLDSEKEIYLPDIKTTVVVDYDGLNMLSYPEYKSLVLEQEERYKEDLLFIEKINKEEEEFYKNQ